MYWCACVCEFNVRVVKIYACKGEVVSERASERVNHSLRMYAYVRAIVIAMKRERNFSLAHMAERGNESVLLTSLNMSTFVVVRFVLFKSDSRYNCIYI